MFEKEAEEYVLENFSYDYYGEFEMKQITEYSAFQKGAEYGYNKANEWHYVKDGKLPKTGNPCLVYLVNDCAIVARLREDNVWTTDGHNAFENVIAWKEIVLPKESE